MNLIIVLFLIFLSNTLFAMEDILLQKLSDQQTLLMRKYQVLKEEKESLVQEFELLRTQSILKSNYFIDEKNIGTINDIHVIQMLSYFPDFICLVGDNIIFLSEDNYVQRIFIGDGIRSYIGMPQLHFCLYGKVVALNVQMNNKKAYDEIFNTLKSMNLESQLCIVHREDEL
jgi:hypothetical protein